MGGRGIPGGKCSTGQRSATASSSACKMHMQNTVCLALAALCQRQPLQQAVQEALDGAGSHAHYACTRNRAYVEESFGLRHSLNPTCIHTSTYIRCIIRKMKPWISSGSLVRIPFHPPTCPALSVVGESKVRVSTKH
jgi:hypothetical protein